jgi:hypothetical protein
MMIKTCSINDFDFPILVEDFGGDAVVGGVGLIGDGHSLLA